MTRDSDRPPEAPTTAQGRDLSGRSAVGRSGLFVIDLIALLVPARRREEWVAEWRGELSWSAAEQRSRGEAGWWISVRMVLRALSAWPDAWWLRRTRGGTGMLRQDLRDAVRRLRRRRGFAAAVVLTMGLGIAAATVVFSALDGLLLRPLPFQEPDRLVQVMRGNRQSFNPYLDADALREWRGQRSVFEEAKAYAGHNVTLTGHGEPRLYRTAELEPGFLHLLGLTPLLGRSFLPEEAVPGRDRVVMLGEELWRSSFGADRSVVGTTIRLDGVRYTVVGVMPRSLRLLPGGLVAMAVPLAHMGTASGPGASLLARLRPGVTLAAAQARLDQVAATLDEERPRAAPGGMVPSGYAQALTGWGVLLEPLQQPTAGMREPLFVLGAGVFLLLLIACGNAAGLLLMDGAVRQQELAIRGALGGTRWALTRQLLVESLVLALLAGGLGVLASHWGLELLLGLIPQSTIAFSYNGVRLDGRVLGFAVLATVATGLLFGVVPALTASGSARTLPAAGRSTTPGSKQQRLRSGLVVVEVALAVMLLSGAGLLGRSFLELQHVDPGFAAGKLVTFTVSLPTRRYADQASVQDFRDRLEVGLSALPGVSGVSFSSGGVPPAANMHFGTELEAEGSGLAPNQPQILPFASVDTGYFHVMGISLLAGRPFSPSDHSDDSAIIDRTLARLLWPGTNPLGRRFRVDSRGPWLTVVGVVNPMKLMGPDDRRAGFVMFYPTTGTGRYMSVAVRAAGDPTRLLQPTRAVVQTLDPELPILHLETGERRYAEALGQPRFLLTLMMLFAAVALMLAAVGTYALVAHGVAQRTREFGVRMALGARSAQIVAAVLRPGLGLALGGTVLGLVGALVLSRFLRSLLFGVAPRDPVSLALASTVLLGASALALILPARRAANADPLETLRAE